MQSRNTAQDTKTRTLRRRYEAFEDIRLNLEIQTERDTERDRDGVTSRKALGGDLPPENRLSAWRRRHRVSSVTNEGNSNAEARQARSPSGVLSTLISVYEHLHGGVERFLMPPSKEQEVTHTGLLCFCVTGKPFISAPVRNAFLSALHCCFHGNSYM